MQEQNVNTKVPEVEDTTTDYLLLFIVAIFKLALLTLLTLLTLLIPIFIRKLLIIIRKRLMINRSVALSPFNNGHCFGSNSTIPRSVNYHFTRQCNYKCGFCFHTAKTSFVLPLDQAKRGLKILKEAGMEKINFSGGEPFIHKRGEFVGELTRYCKLELKLPSVTIVCNGSLVTERWFKKYGEFLDILAVSCDSFNEETNLQIGRHQNGKDHLRSLSNARDWCRKYRIAFKINTVVNSFNVEEDMNHKIQELAPVRWKVFQCLLIEGENCGQEALRDAEKFVISDDNFSRFVQRHSTLSCLVPESNEKMRNSYLILDEYMRFLDCRGGGKIPSKSILDVGVESAINASGFDEKMFLKRGGKYTWSKADMNLTWVREKSVAREKSNVNNKQ